MIMTGVTAHLDCLRGLESKLWQVIIAHFTTCMTEHLRHDSFMSLKDPSGFILMFSLSKKGISLSNMT